MQLQPIRRAVAPLRDPAMIELKPLAADPRYAKEVETLAALEKRFAQSEQRKRVAEARLRGQQPTSSLTDRAKALVAGGQIVNLPADAELAAAEEERRVLNAAIIAQREKLAAVASEISHEVCGRFATANAEALRNALAAVTDLWQALEVGRVIRGRLIGAGYSISEAALPIEQFPAGAALGDPERVGLTPSALFKQRLAAAGVI